MYLGFPVCIVFCTRYGHNELNGFNTHSGRLVEMDFFSLRFRDETNERKIYLEKSSRQRPKIVIEFKHWRSFGFLNFHGWLIQWNEYRTISNKNVFSIVLRIRIDIIVRALGSRCRWWTLFDLILSPSRWIHFIWIDIVMRMGAGFGLDVEFTKY